MTTTETTEAPALRDSIVNHIDGIAASGRTMVASRRDGRHRDDRLIAEIAGLDAEHTAGDDHAG